VDVAPDFDEVEVEVFVAELALPPEVPDPAVELVDVLLTEDSFADDPVAVAVAEEDAVAALVAAAALPEAVAVAEDPVVADPEVVISAEFVVDDPVVVVAVFAVALLAEPEVTVEALGGAAVTLESEVAAVVDPEVPETTVVVTAELVLSPLVVVAVEPLFVAVAVGPAPVLLAATAAELDVVPAAVESVPVVLMAAAVSEGAAEVWGLVVAAVESVPALAEEGAGVCGLGVAASLVVVEVAMEEAVDPPDVSSGVELDAVASVLVVADVVPSDELVVVTGGLEDVVESDEVDVPAAVDEVPVLVAVLDSPVVVVDVDVLVLGWVVPEVADVLEMVDPVVGEVVDAPTSTEDPLVTAPSQLSSTITELPWASCSKWNVEHVVCAEALEMARSVTSSDARTFIAGDGGGGPGDELAKGNWGIVARSALHLCQRSPRTGEGLSALRPSRVKWAESWSCACSSCRVNVRSARRHRSCNQRFPSRIAMLQVAHVDGKQPFLAFSSSVVPQPLLSDARARLTRCTNSKVAKRSWPSGKPLLKGSALPTCGQPGVAVPKRWTMTHGP